MFSCSHFSHFLSDPIGKQSAMAKRGQEATSSEGSLMAKTEANDSGESEIHQSGVTQPVGSARENPPQDLGYPANPVNVDEGQGSQTSTRKIVRAVTARTE